MQVILFALAHSVFLFPVYYLEGEELPEFTLETLTLGNLESRDNALYTALIPVYTISIYLIYLIWHEFLEFKSRRQDRLSLREIDNYSVVLEDLPVSLRNSEDLYELLDSWFPENLDSVYVPANLSKLRKLVNARVRTRNSLEVSLIKEQNNEAPGCSCACPRRGSPSARIDALYKKLEDLNNDVIKQVKLVEDGPENVISSKTRNPLVEKDKTGKQKSRTESPSKVEQEKATTETSEEKSSGKSEQGQASPTSDTNKPNAKTQLEIEKEKVGEMPLREVKAELQQRGIDISTFNEKRQFVDALAEARIQEEATNAQEPEPFNYEKVLQEEREVIKSMSLKAIKSELDNLDIAYPGFVEKSQFVNALAEARARAKKEDQDGSKKKKKKKMKKKKKPKQSKEKVELPKCCLSCMKKRQRYRKRDIFQKRVFNNKCCNSCSNGMDSLVWRCSVACVRLYERFTKLLKGCSLAKCKTALSGCAKSTKRMCFKVGLLLRNCCVRTGKGAKSGCRGCAKACKRAKSNGATSCSKCCSKVRQCGQASKQWFSRLRVKIVMCCTSLKERMVSCCARMKGSFSRRCKSSRSKDPAEEEPAMAFVTFRSLHVAMQFRQAFVADALPRHLTSAGPILTDMDWTTVPTVYKTKMIKRAVSLTSTALVIIFWSVPTAFVGALSAIENLKSEIPGLADALEAAPWLVGLIEQLSPLLLVILGSLAPLVLGALTNLEGHLSRSEADASLFTKLAAFQVVQTFFVAAISGSLFNVLTEVIEDPALLPPLLGGSIPGQSTFFMQFICIQTGLTLTLDLLRVAPIVTGAIYKCCAPKVTWRQQESAWFGLREVNQPGPMAVASKLGSAFLVFLLGLVYAPLAPLLTYFAGLYFLVAEVIHRRQALYVYDPFMESKALFWPKLYDFMLAACIIAQLTLLGVLSLKESPAAAVILPLTIATATAFSCISRRFNQESMYLAIDRAVEMDATREEEEGFDAAYYQPELFEGYVMEPELVKPVEKDSLASPGEDE